MALLPNLKAEHGKRVFIIFKTALPLYHFTVVKLHKAGAVSAEYCVIFHKLEKISKKGFTLLW